MSKKIKKTVRMKKEDAAAWLAALRSGIYARGGGELYSRFPDVYCCLGVLEKVLSGRTEREATLPTARWCKKHGISCVDKASTRDFVDVQLIPKVGNLGCISSVNDSGKYSFKQIANILEKRIETY